MKRHLTRPPFLIAILLISGFAASWYPTSRVRARYAGNNYSAVTLTQDGAISGERPEEPSAIDREKHPYYDGPRIAGPADQVTVIIELEDAPAASVFAENARAGLRIIPTARAVAAARARVTRILESQQRIASALKRPGLNARILSATQKVFNGVSVRVAAGNLPQIRQLPGVKAVHIPARYYKTTDTSVPYIGAPTVWSSGFTGSGIRVAIIDTGIDYVHTDFGGSGDQNFYDSNDPTVIEPGSFPTAKIVDGYDFVGDGYPSNPVPQPDPDPYDCNSHGTRIAGVLGGFGVNLDGTRYTGPYGATTNFNNLLIGPGVAPGVELLAYKIFGCRGSTTEDILLQAIDRALDPNNDGDFSDKVDIINLSLGSPFAPPSDTPSLRAIESASLLDVLTVISTGNNGDTFFSVNNPGMSPAAVSVAAVFDNPIRFQKLDFNISGNLVSVPAGRADFGPGVSRAGISTGVVASSPANGCQPLSNSSQMAGKIALIDRGTCSFTTKVRNAMSAGAVGAIITNDTNAQVIGFSDDGTGQDISIPSWLIDLNSGNTLRDALNAGQTIIAAASHNSVFNESRYANRLATFSSRGGPFSNSIIKPDISAPGLSISSADAGTGSGYGFYNGTSMSSPHVSGSAALLLDAYPGRNARDIASILLNTADPVFSGDNNSPPEHGPGRTGSGQVNMDSFTQQPAFGQVTTTQYPFGKVQEITGVTNTNLTYTINNPGGSAQTYTVQYQATSSIPGVNLTFPNGPTVSVPGNSTGDLVVNWNFSPQNMKHTFDPTLATVHSGQPRHWLSDASGYLNLIPSGGGARLRIPSYIAARPASNMAAQQNSIDLSSGQTGFIGLSLAGNQVFTGNTFPTDVISIASPFEWVESNPDDPDIPEPLNYLDLQNIGIRSSPSQSGGFDQGRVLFGISTHGSWLSPNHVTFNVFIDTNQDGTMDYQLFNTSFPNETGAPGDAFVTRLINLSNNQVTTQAFINSFSAAQFDTAPFGTNVIVLPVLNSSLGLTESDASFDYVIKTSLNNVDIDFSRRHTFDAANPTLNFGTNTIFFDLNNSTVPVNFNTGNIQGDDDFQGMFLIHHQNAPGNRVQALPANLGLEGDVAPRGATDGAVDLNDWAQIQDFLINVDQLNDGSEFQRADTSPKDSAGDGGFNVRDVVQAGRYGGGIDPVIKAGGPYLPVIIKNSVSSDDRDTLNLTGQTSTLRIVESTISAGQTNTLNIEIDAQGGENAIAFTLSFDPSVLSFVAAARGNVDSMSRLSVNSSQSSAGLLAMVLALPPGQALPAGTRTLATVQFDLTQGGAAFSTQVSFGGQIVAPQIADLNANALTVNTTNGTITIVRAVASVSAASFLGATLASESIVAGFGLQLATRVVVADTVPLPTNLAGTTIIVKDSIGTERLSPLFFVAPGQVNYQIPPGTLTGQAMIKVTGGDGSMSVGSVNIASVAPGIFSANANGQGVAAAVVLRVRGDGTQSFEPVITFDQVANQFVPLPVDLGPETDQVFLIMFGTGFRLNSSLSAVSATIDGVNSEVLFAGAQGGFVGLDQLNLRLIRALIGRGVVNIVVTVDGIIANTVTISIAGPPGINPSLRRNQSAGSGGD